MRTHSLENQSRAIDLVDKQPIRFDVAVAPVLPITDQLMVSVNRIQRLIGEQRPRNPFEFLRILATTQAALQILFKLTRLNGNKHGSKAELLKQVICIFADH